MTLLLNYRPVLHEPTGIGIYANAVLPALQTFPNVLVEGSDSGGSWHRLNRLAWSQFQLPRLASQNHASLIFSPAPEGYLGPQEIPQVVMVHDLRPISHPERSLQSLYFRGWVPPLLRSCRHVLTNSYFTAREIQSCTGLADGRITVIPLGYDERVFKPDVVTRTSQQSPYLLHVGQAYPHKNLFRLIQAFAGVAVLQPDLRLILAGKPHPKETPRLRAMVKEMGLQHRVEFRSYVPFDTLPTLYADALALVYPSLWEGFGLPILEAMACGTPVITSLGSGTEEVAGDAALLVDPHKLSSIIDALSLLMVDSALLSDLRTRGLIRAKNFSWKRTASLTALAVSQQL